MPPTPVDYVARAVVYLAERQAQTPGIFHISASAQNAQGIFERCNQVGGTSLALLTRYEWTREIKRLHEQGHSLPVVPLIESDFSVSEKAFLEQQQYMESIVPRFDFSWTHRELENAGIVAPVLDEHLLAVYLEGMFAWDPELEALRKIGTIGSGKRKYG